MFIIFSYILIYLCIYFIFCYELHVCKLFLYFLIIYLKVC